MTDLNYGKQLAANSAVDDWLLGRKVIGIGSGSTIVHVVKRISQIVSENNLCIKCVPTSFQATQLIIEGNLSLASIEQFPEIDVAFDGVDEITSRFEVIKGGGGCLLQEKIVDTSAKVFIVVADNSKLSDHLGKKWSRGIPLEVIPMASKKVKTKIEEKLGGTVELRPAISKMGPCVSDNGNFIMDWKFIPTTIKDWNLVDVELHMIPGIVETGLFLNVVTQAYIGNASGNVTVLSAPT